MALDLNMGYYKLQIPPQIKYMKTTVTLFGNFGYHWIPMGMLTSGDSLKFKVDYILVEMEGFKTYIDNILVLTNDSFTEHI